jgi:hypothetical protein
MWAVVAGTLSHHLVFDVMVATVAGFIIDVQLSAEEKM